MCLCVCVLLKNCDSIKLVASGNKTVRLEQNITNVSVDVIVVIAVVNVIAVVVVVVAVVVVVSEPAQPISFNECYESQCERNRREREKEREGKKKVIAYST